MKRKRIENETNGHLTVEISNAKKQKNNEESSVLTPFQWSQQLFELRKNQERELKALLLDREQSMNEVHFKQKYIGFRKLFQKLLQKSELCFEYEQFLLIQHLEKQDLEFLELFHQRKSSPISEDFLNSLIEKHEKAIQSILANHLDLLTQKQEQKQMTQKLSLENSMPSGKLLNSFSPNSRQSTLSKLPSPIQITLKNLDESWLDLTKNISHYPHFLFTPSFFQEELQQIIQSYKNDGFKKKFFC